MDTPTLAASGVISYRKTDGTWVHRAADKSAENRRLDRRAERAVAVAELLAIPDRALAEDRRRRFRYVIARLNLSPLEAAQFGMDR